MMFHSDDFHHQERAEELLAQAEAMYADWVANGCLIYPDGTFAGSANLPIVLGLAQVHATLGTLEGDS